VPVSLALNGVTFGVTGVPVRFYYKGLHVPVLVDVYFPQAATSWPEPEPEPEPEA